MGCAKCTASASWRKLVNCKTILLLMVPKSTHTPMHTPPINANSLILRHLPPPPFTLFNTCNTFSHCCDFSRLLPYGSKDDYTRWATGLPDGSFFAYLSPFPSPQERGVCHEAREGVCGASPSPAERDLGRGLTVQVLRSSNALAPNGSVAVSCQRGDYAQRDAAQNVENV